MGEEAAPVKLGEKEILLEQIDHLRIHAAVSRIKISNSVADMMEWVQSKMEGDRFVNPDHPKNKKENPWVENKKCSII